MALYDQNQIGQTPWYAPQNQYSQTNPARVQTSAIPNQIPSPINQFVWVNGPGTVDMWPVQAGSEMTFIDNENMCLYVKRVDEYNHPLKVRKFKLTEITDNEVMANPPQPAINMEELKAFLSSEVDRAVSSRFFNMFGGAPKGEVANA